MSKKKRLKEEVSIQSEVPKKDTSQKIPQRDKLKQELNIYTREDYTDKQKYLVDLILDKKTNIVFLAGCAGTSKTHVSVYAGLKALNNKTQSDILYLRSAIESASKSLGALPGEIDQKIGPYLIPLQDKLEEMLPKNEVDFLIKDHRIQGNVVNYIRGASWNAKFIIVDEAQNLTREELKTVLSRMGKYSKLIICGDPDQSDLKEKSGFMDMFDKFNSEKSQEFGIHCFSFNRDDIVRSKFLGYILDVIEGVYTPGT